MRFFVYASCLAVATSIRRGLVSEANDLEIRAHTEGMTGEVIDGEYGHYQLGRKLGAGAYGTVYLATEQQTGTQVVAKVIDIRFEEPLTSFFTERRIWKHMQSCSGYPHPNVVQHFEVLELPNKKGVVMMELAGGGSLSDSLYKGVSAEGALGGRRTALGDALMTDEKLAKMLFGQLAAGAQWLGECGVVHKDLKPDNIMLTKPFLEGGIIKIIDFGLAILTSDQRAGGLANMYYNLYSSVDPRTNPKGTRTFDDFALGLILAEIGTGVPPYFNPKYDYYSEKPGNLQLEKGIFYILQPKKVCSSGDSGIATPKRDLATGKISIKQAVKEVVGRSLYYLHNGRHFIYTSAVEQGVGNQQLLLQSWLYNSPTAMMLLSSLMAAKKEMRVEPKDLFTSEKAVWLRGVQVIKGETEASEDEVPPVATPELHFQPPEPPLKEDLPSEDEPNEITEPEPEPEMEVEEAPKFDMCKHPYKERGPPSLCKVRHASHGDCYVTVSCGGAPSKVVKVEQGFGAGTVPNCRNCRLA